MDAEPTPPDSDPQPPGSHDVDPTPAVDEELAATEGRWSEDLRQLLTPGAGMERRTADSVDRTLRGRSVGATALDLLGVGWHTLRLLAGDDPPDGASAADRGVRR